MNATAIFANRNFKDIFIKDMTQKEAILAEFRKLATDREFSLPEIDFLEYTFDKKKKLKRVESNRR